MDDLYRARSFIGPGNCNRIQRKPIQSCTLVVFGFVISLVVWLIDSTVEFFLFSGSRNGFIEGVLAPNPRKWIHLLIAAIIMAFSIYAQLLLNRRRRAEVTLGRSQSFTKRVLDSMNDAVAVINVSDYRLVMVNSVFLKELGIEEDEALGKTCYEVTHALSESCCHEDHPCPLLETVVTGNFSQAHHIHVGKDGGRRDVEISVSPVRDEHGKIIQVIHVSRDMRRALERGEFCHHRADAPTPLTGTCS